MCDSNRKIDLLFTKLMHSSTTNQMITDIIQNIINFSFVQQQIDLCQMDKYMYNNTYIYKLKIKSRYKNIINQKIIEQKKFSRLKKLCVTNVKKIYDVNHLAETLICLKCGILSSIDQSGIAKLKNLKKLVMKGNNYIHNLDNVAHCLEYLDCSSVPCEYDDTNYFYTSLNPGTFEKLRLRVLIARDCGYIKDLYDMNGTLRKLNCDGSCGIDQNAILKLSNIEYLSCNGNNKIHNVNHLQYKLKKLNCKYFSGINQSGITDLLNLESLQCDFNDKIHDISHLSDTLTKLKCNSFFTQDMITKMTKLRNISFNNNNNIKDLSCLDKTLTYLDLGLCIEFTNENLRKLNNLKILVIGKSDINYDLDHLKNTLEVLKCGQSAYMNGSPGVDQNSINYLKKIRILHIRECKHVNDITMFSDTLEELYIDRATNKSVCDNIQKMKKLKKLCLEDSTVEIKDLMFACESIQKIDAWNEINFINKENICKYRRLQSLCPNKNYTY